MATKKLTRTLLQQVRRRWPQATAEVEHRNSSHQALRLRMQGEQEVCVTFSLTPSNEETCVKEVLRDVRRCLNKTYQ
jgi:hypothetical protein